MKKRFCHVRLFPPEIRQNGPCKRSIHSTLATYTWHVYAPQRVLCVTDAAEGRCIGAVKVLMLSGLPFAYTLSGYAFGCIRDGIAVTRTLRKARKHGYTGYAFAFADTRAGGGARGGNPHYIYVYAFCLITYTYTLFV